MENDTEAHDNSGPKPRKRTYKKIAVLLIIGLCIAAASVYFLRIKHSPSSLPASVTDSLNYSIYFPKGAANGYSYKIGSASTKTGLLFYTLEKGSKKIYITEQALPDSQLNFSSLPNHTAINVPIGQGLLGTGLGNPSIVITSDTTLLELTSSKGVTKDDIISVAQKMALINY